MKPVIFNPGSVNFRGISSKVLFQKFRLLKMIWLFTLFWDQISFIALTPELKIIQASKYDWDEWDVFFWHSHTFQLNKNINAKMGFKILLHFKTYIFASSGKANSQKWPKLSIFIWKAFIISLFYSMPIFRSKYRTSPPSPSSGICERKESE